MRRVLAISGALLLTASGMGFGQEQTFAASSSGPALDYEFFKTKVEPVFLTKRAGHTRCVVCHTQNNAPFHLVQLSPGSTTWNEQQSQQNFQLIQRVALPGSLDSPLVHHPLAQSAGGDPHHGGGDQFASQQDPAWQTLRAFIMGEKAK